MSLQGNSNTDKEPAEGEANEEDSPLQRVIKRVRNDKAAEKSAKELIDNIIDDRGVRATTRTSLLFALKNAKEAKEFKLLADIASTLLDPSYNDIKPADRTYDASKALDLFLENVTKQTH